MFLKVTHSKCTLKVQTLEIHALFSNHHLVETNYFRHVQATDSVNPVLRKEVVSRVEQVVKRRVP